MVRNIASENLQTDCAVHNVPMDGNCLFTSLALQLDRPAAASRDNPHGSCPILGITYRNGKLVVFTTFF